MDLFDYISQYSAIKLSMHSLIAISTVVLDTWTQILRYYAYYLRSNNWVWLNEMVSVYFSDCCFNMHTTEIFTYVMYTYTNVRIWSQVHYGNKEEMSLENISCFIEFAQVHMLPSIYLRGRKVKSGKGIRLCFLVCAYLYVSAL